MKFVIDQCERYPDLLLKRATKRDIAGTVVIDITPEEYDEVLRVTNEYDAMQRRLGYLQRDAGRKFFKDHPELARRWTGVSSE